MESLKVSESIELKMELEYERIGEGEIDCIYTVLYFGDDVGRLEIREFNDMCCYIERLDIDEAFRNKGIGAEVIRHVAREFCGAYGAPDNPISQRLCERLGREALDDWSYFDQGYNVYKF